MASPIPAWSHHAPPHLAEFASFLKADPNLQIPRYGARIGTIGLLAPQGITTEAMPIPELYALPWMPDWFLGITQRRGDVVPVFDLKRLWFPDMADAGPRALWILDKGEAAAGVLVDGLPHALRDSDTPEAIPEMPAALKDFASAPQRHAGNLYWEFRHSALFHGLRASLAAGSSSLSGTFSAP